MEWRIKKLLLEPHRSLTLGPRYEIGPLSGGFFITREGIKRGREKEKRRESARKEEGRECVKKKKREGKA